MKNSSLKPNLSSLLKIWPFLLASFFAVLINFFEGWLFLNPQGYFLAVLQGRETVHLFAGVLTTFFSFCFLVFYFWLSLRVKQQYRFLFLILFAIPVLVEFSYWKTFHRPFSMIDMETALTSPPQLWNTSFFLFFNALGLIPVAGYALYLFIPGSTRGPRPIFLALAMVVCAVVNTGIECSALPTNWGTSLLQFYKTAVQWGLTDFESTKRSVVPNISTSIPGNNILLIIDESIRSDHLSLNGYERATTPFLVNLQNTTGLVTNWGTAVSGATCSPLSNALIISGVRVAEETGSQAENLTRQAPTLFHYARAMGYKTYYLDGQTDYLWNGLTVADLAAVDGWVNTKELGNDQQVDFRAADWIRNQVDRSTGNFIVLNKKGVHFLYEESYPAEETIWGPAPEDYRTQPELVKNVYDNGIRYSVDLFFERLLKDNPGILDNTIILYTSDHGQTLFENGVNWLHCNYTREEASVPLLMIGKLPKPPDTTYPASHSNLFPTILELMGVPVDRHTMDYASSLLSAKSSDADRRFYLSGNGSVMEYFIE
jgi:glucan phosphoethanolaminetransferase (alkaline phosphatase superfamily)